MRDQRGSKPESDPERAAKSVLEDMKASGERHDAVAPSVESLDVLLATEAMENALPNIPPIPGYHTFWASLTNTYTPVQYYLRLGYVPIRKEEIPSLMHLKAHSAEYGDSIVCNEMLAMKVPDDIYQKYMTVMHFDRPNAEGEKILEQIANMKEEARDSDGGQLVQQEGDGFDSLVDRRVKNPRF